jgi:hypothetical protein
MFSFHHPISFCKKKSAVLDYRFRIRNDRIVIGRKVDNAAAKAEIAFMPDPLCHRQVAASWTRYTFWDTDHAPIIPGAGCCFH